METPKFNRLATRLIGEKAAATGFTHYKRLYFIRPRNQWTDVFFLDLLRPTKDSFKVVVGIHIPNVRAKLQPLYQHDSPTAPISRSVGSRGLEEFWYDFTDVDSLKAAVDRMWLDFEKFAEPWLKSFNSIRDVADNYFEREIIEENLPGGTKYFPSPGRWAIYGYLLIEAGNIASGREWLLKAEKLLRKPSFLNKYGQTFYEKVPGSKEVSLSEDDCRLLEILNNDLHTNEHIHISP